MPCSLTSSPFCSSMSETRRKLKAFIAENRTNIVMNDQAHMASVPVNWTPNDVAPLSKWVFGKMPIAMQPHTPHKP